MRNNRSVSRPRLRVVLSLVAFGTILYPSGDADDGAGPPRLDLTLGQEAERTAATSAGPWTPPWLDQIRQDIAASEYLPFPHEDGYQAPNRANNLRAFFTSAGFRLTPRLRESSDAWSFHWHTVGLARGDASPATGSQRAPAKIGPRVIYAWSDVEEWYHNRPDGLEQGFLVPARPPGAGPLRLVGEWRGERLEARFVESEERVDFCDAAGTTVLSYGKLHVVDASGREVPSRLSCVGDEITLTMDDEVAAYPLHVDPLLSSPVWTMEGKQEGAFYGISVSAAGDVNGDGHGDVVVGAQKFDHGETDEGSAFLYLGNAHGLSFLPACSIEADQQGAYLGYCVAAAGDVNGDGYDDVIVGAPFMEESRADEGRVSLHLGSADGLSSVPAWTAFGGQNSAYLGHCVAPAGDVNGDGFDDVIAVAEFHDNGQTDEGRAYVYHGSIGGLDAEPTWWAEGDQPQAYFGVCAAGAGDLNGDGYDDIIVGAHGYDGGQANEGKVFVYLGSSGGLDPAAQWTREGNQAGGSYGSSVDGAGDVNGDGYDDVVIGAQDYTSEEAGAGAAWVHLGSALGLETEPSWYGSGDQAHAQYGVSAGTAGDINGDGFSDVIIGARWASHGQEEEGRAFVYLGSTGGLEDAPHWTGESDRAEARYGRSVATAGDINGDGYDDVIVGAYCYTDQHSAEGKAYVYLGSSAGLPLGVPWIGQGDQPGAYFGYSVAGAGDVNGDGFDDIIVGAPFYDHGQADEGAAFVYCGSPSGPAAGPCWFAEPNQASAYLGHCVASAGDVNGDGFDDVIAVAEFYDNGEQDEGRVYVFHGSPAGPASAPAWTDEGDQDLAYFGMCAGTAGDVNADGYDDIIIGAHGHDGGQVDEGRVCVYHGSADGLTIDPVWSSEADQASAWYGVAVGAAGDVNGDGYADVVIGADGYDGDLADEGKAWIFSGSAQGLAAEPSWTALGGRAGAHFGIAASTAGDVNGDGYADVVLGARMYSHGQDEEGQVRIYHGSADGLLLEPAWSMESNQPGARLGRSVAGAGDVNADGFDDVIVGAYRYDDHYADEGAVFIYPGSTGGLSPNARYLTASGGQPGGYFGISVSSAGDVNGDGLGDVIVGAQYQSDGENSEGMAFVYYGATAPVSVGPRQGVRAESVRLAPPAPNPCATDVITITWSLASRQEVTLTLHDASGRRVAAIHRGEEQAGSHAWRWNRRDDSGRRVPAGVYFVRLSAGAQPASRKLVLE